MSVLPSIGAVRTGCLCCPPKPEVAPMDWQPHPGFGMLGLTRDGETPDGWADFCDWQTREVYVSGSFQMRDHKTGGMKTVEYADFEHVHLAEALTLADIEAAVADDPDHDWRLEIHGPLGGVIYQRQGCAQWVAVERLDGFA